MLTNCTDGDNVGAGKKATKELEWDQVANATTKRRWGRLFVGRLTRRQFIKVAGGSLALAFMDYRSFLASAGSAAGAQRSSWTIDSPALNGGVFETEALDAGHQFTALTAAWQHAAPGIDDHAVSIEVSTSDDGSDWSDWSPLHRDHHAPVTDEGWRHHSPLLRPGRFARLRLSGPDGAVRSIKLTAIDSSLDSGRAVAGDAQLIDGFIIPRAAWGADESYRYEDQDFTKPVLWPPEYQQPWKVVVHHTVTDFGWDDPAAVVRAIYQYHAITLEWGDIGYNFLIDMYGNVYEGRFGGPNVIGGHALEFNRGSMGVAIIGDFNAAWPSQAALDSLVRLIAARTPQIDPAAATDWIGWSGVPNICGHGDVLETECPGYTLHETLPVIRGRLAGTSPVYLPPPILRERPRILSFSAGPQVVGAGEVIEIRAEITNDGVDDLATQGPDPGFIYDEGQDFSVAGYPKVEGRYRLAVDIVGSDGVANPYRWGFGAPLAHAEIREVVGYIRTSDVGSKNLVASIVKEWVRYYDDDGRSVQAIYTVHPLIARAQQTGEPGSLYFPETGHNVPAPFVRYWNENGGLARFGYPLTEAFSEISVTDGQTYLTQYFERARFEWHPELAARGFEVLLGLLGSEQTAHRWHEAPFQPIEPFESRPDYVYFPETGHSTSYRFLEYWRANGGLEAFGFPISEKFEEISPTDGQLHLVQYFERHRFEYHPQYPEPEKQILLGHLAREILIARGWLPGPTGSPPSGA